MKKTFLKIILILSLSFFTLVTFAASWDKEIILSSQESKVNINDTFSISFMINLENGNNLWDVDVKWLEKFDKLWQSSSFSFQSVNWVSKSVQEVLIQLKPIENWKFTIWPVTAKLWDKELLSNTIEVEVSWNLNKANTTSTKNNNTLSNNEDKELTIDDLHDIEWSKSKFDFDFWFLIAFLIILFFFGFYYTYRYFTKLNEQKIKEEEDKETDYHNKNNYFLEKLKTIEKNKDKYKKWEFFALVNDFLREFLEFKWLNNARNMTFKELEKNKDKINIDLFEIIKTTYFQEFKKDEEDIDRKDLIKRIKNLLLLK